MYPLFYNKTKLKLSGKVALLIRTYGINCYLELGVKEKNHVSHSLKEEL